MEKTGFQAWAETGITDPAAQLIRGKTDRGSNMIKGYENVPHDPCVDHLIETSNVA